MKKYICMLLVLGISSFMITGCNNNSNKTNFHEEPAVNLVYYTIGNSDKDLKLVNQELNKLLSKKTNTKIEYNKIAWADYGERLATMISSGTKFDLAFASTVTQGDYVGNAQKGAWLNLTPYLETLGNDMYRSINPLYWEGITIDNKVFGVPTNKEIAVPLMFMYPQSLIEKYNIDIKKYRTIQSVEPLLEIIAQNEPEYIGLELDSNTNNYFAIDGYECIISHNIPLMVKSTDKSLKVVNIFETDEGKDVLSCIRRYYQLGYINEDAAVKKSSNLKPNEKVFLKMSEGGPYSEISWSNDRQYKVVSQQVSDLVVTSGSTRGGIMVANSQTQYPEKCVEVLNCINTDSEVRNLLNFGIEGIHYNLTENNQVNKISNNYSGVQYTQGNWFILHTVVGEPFNKWDEFTIFNNSAFKSEILGFTANTNSFQKELVAIENVWKKYYPYIMTGSVDIDYFLPQFVDELKAAGIDQVKEILQLQLQNWKQGNQ